MGSLRRSMVFYFRLAVGIAVSTSDPETSLSKEVRGAAVILQHNTVYQHVYSSIAAC